MHKSFTCLKRHFRVSVLIIYAIALRLYAIHAKVVLGINAIQTAEHLTVKVHTLMKAGYVQSI